MEDSRARVLDVVTNLTAIAEKMRPVRREASATTQEFGAMDTISGIGADVDKLVLELTDHIDKFKVYEQNA